MIRSANFVPATVLGLALGLALGTGALLPEIASAATGSLDGRANIAEPDTVRDAPEPIRLRIVPPALRVDPRVHKRPEQREPRLEPFSYAARSLLWPGWGQGALGDSRKAFVYSAIFGASIPWSTGLAPVPLIDDDDFSQSVGFALWGAVAVMAAIDAFRGAEHINRENGYDLEERLLEPRYSRTVPAASDLASGAREALRFVVLRREF